MSLKTRIGLDRVAGCGFGAGDAWAIKPYLTMNVTLLDTETNAARRTLRVDFDGSTLVVGNETTHQLVGGLDRPRPDVFELSGCPIPELAAFAADWIERELAADERAE